MSARLLLEVALRVLGIWFLFNSLITLAGVAPIYLSGVWNSSVANMPVNFVAFGVTFVVQCGLGGALIFWAPGLAAEFYPPDVENEGTPVSVGPGDVYRTACFVLGVYLLVQAVRPASRIAIAGFQMLPTNYRSIQLASDAMTTVVYTVVGMLLVFGSDKIGQWLSSLRYDPNSIPKPQFTIAAILIAIVIFAVCMAVVRTIMVGGL